MNVFMSHVSFGRSKCLLAGVPWIDESHSDELKVKIVKLEDHSWDKLIGLTDVKRRYVDSRRHISSTWQRGA
jgi:hypothetical protein